MAVFLKSTKDDLHPNGGFPKKYKRRFSYILMAGSLKSTKGDLHTNGGFPEKYKRRFSY